MKKITISLMFTLMLALVSKADAYDGNPKKLFCRGNCTYVIPAHTVGQQGYYTYWWGGTVERTIYTTEPAEFKKVNVNVRVPLKVTDVLQAIPYVENYCLANYPTYQMGTAAVLDCALR